MNRQWISRALLGVAFSLILGCDKSSPLRSTDQRVNDAFPVPAKLLEAKTRLDETPALDKSSAELLETEYQTRLRLRALGCVQGREPTILESSEKLRSRLSTDCFKKSDAETLAWLNERRIRRLLAAPALRPIPATAPKVISSSNNIGSVQFASAAGIAIVTLSKNVEVVDIGSDESLYSGTSPVEPAWPPEISPNGRVFSLGGSKEGVVLQDSLSGEVLATYPDHLRFIWLDSTSALLQRKDGGGLDLLDMEGSSLQSVKGQPGNNPLILPVTAGPPRVVIGGNRYLSLFELQRDAKGLRLALVDQILGGPPAGWADSRSGFNTNGNLLIQFHPPDLWLLDLTVKTISQVQANGFMVAAASPLSDPDKVLLRTFVYGSPSNQTYAIYSIGGKYFSPVLNEELADAPATQITYIPSIDRVGFVMGKSIKVIDHFQHEARYDSTAYAQYLQNQANQLQQKAAAAEAVRMMGNMSGAGTPVSAGPILELSKTARIEAVGVYEGMSGNSSARVQTARIRMPVNIVVRKSDRPIVLVLSSYEAVEWHLSMMPGAQLKAVLVSGYKDATVSGAGDIRIVNIGTRYAYDRRSSDYAQLQRDVFQWTGQPIGVFQGKYQGGTFLVGGM